MSRSILCFLVSVCITRVFADRAPLNIGVLLPYEGNYPWTVDKVLPSMEMAVETIVENSVLPSFRLRLMINDSSCSGRDALLSAIDQRERLGVKAFFGPVCSYALAPVTRFTRWRKVPVISAGGPDIALDDKSEYSLLTRIHPPYSSMAKTFVELCTTLGWHRVGLLFQKPIGHGIGEESTCHFMMEVLNTALIKILGKNLWSKSFDENDPSLDFVQTLKDISAERQILALCASPNAIRKIMLAANELNLVNGDYVFINIDLVLSQADVEKPWYRADDTPENNKMALKAYEALLTLTLRQPANQEYNSFVRRLRRRGYRHKEVSSYVTAFYDGLLLYALALNETLAENGGVYDGTEVTRRMWNRTYSDLRYVSSVKGFTVHYFKKTQTGGFMLIEGNTVSSYVTAFYDGLLLYALALNETLAENGGVYDGTEVTRRMWNRTYSGIEGTVYIDENGDRKGDYSLLELNPNTGNLEVVFNYYGYRGEFERVEGKTIHWAGEHIPNSGVTPEGKDGDITPSPGQICPTATEVALEVVKMLEERQLVSEGVCPSGWHSNKVCTRALVEFTEVKNPERFCRTIGYIANGKCHIDPGQTVSPNVCCNGGS